MKKFALIITTLIFSNCINLSVYIPHKKSTIHPTGAFAIRQDLEGISLSKINDIPNLQIPDTIHIQGKYTPFFAWHSPCLFVMENNYIKNIYGNIQQVIADDIINYPNFYFSHSKKIKNLTINIAIFKLESIDTCFKNTVSISLEINTQIIYEPNLKKEEIHFNYKDQINSRVTDLYIISVLGTIPVLIHSGFRGNRQDQLNELGKLGLKKFSENLQKALSKNGSEEEDKDEIIETNNSQPIYKYSTRIRR